MTFLPQQFDLLHVVLGAALLIQLIFPSLLSSAIAHFASLVADTAQKTLPQPQPIHSPRVSLPEPQHHNHNHNHPTSGEMSPPHRQSLPQYAAETDEMVLRLFKMAGIDINGQETENDVTAQEWNLLVNELPFIQVYQHVNSDHCYKIIATLDATEFTVFDILSSIVRRKEWDQMVDEVCVLKEHSASTKIQYMKMKPVWPTSSRDVLVLSHCRQVNGKLVNVTKSIEDDSMPVRESEGIVRLEAEIAGQIVFKVTIDGEEKARVIQIADGDPKGWIPKSVVKFVATKAIPGSFRHLNKLVSTFEPKSSSDLLIDHESGCPMGKYMPQSSSLNDFLTNGSVPHDQSKPSSSNAGEEKEVKKEKEKVKVREECETGQVMVLKETRLSSKKYPISNRFLLWIRGYLKFGSPFMVTAMFVLYMIQWTKGRRLV